MKLSLPFEFTSERLSLRAYRPGDGAQYFHVILENWDHLYEFLAPPQAEMKDETEAEGVIRWLNAEWQQRNLFVFGVWEKESGRFIGETYLANPDWRVPSLEIGYFVIQAATGRGYATEAAQASLRYAFDHLQVGRVDLQCRADHFASQRVAEHCGFRLEGCQRLRHRMKNGRLVDRWWYGLLRSEWRDGPAR